MRRAMRRPRRGPARWRPAARRPGGLECRTSARSESVQQSKIPTLGGGERWRRGRDRPVPGSGVRSRRSAGRSGVSKGMVVQIEGAKTNPSIGTLCRLADAFGVTIARLLESPHEPAMRIVDADAPPMLWRGQSGGAARLLSGINDPDFVELWDWRLEPGESRSSPDHAAGTREMVHVLTSALTVTVGGVDHRVRRPVRPRSTLPTVHTGIPTWARCRCSPWWWSRCRRGVRPAEPLTGRSGALLAPLALRRGVARDDRRVDVLQHDLPGDDDPGHVRAARDLVHHR